MDTTTKLHIINAVKDAGPDACPPMVVGVGIGGTFEKCAVLAKQNSKAVLDKNTSVDYTYIKYVKKHPNKKLGMVHYTDYKTIIV